ncbi:MAG: hypothetical protein ACK59M_10890 [Pseudomonadota bacterium]|jgi:hypothetical protein
MNRRLAVSVLVMLFAACGNPQRSELKLLEKTLDEYASTVRWGTPEQIVAFIDPQVLQDRPLREFDLERLRQLRVAGFRADPPVVIAEGRARQAAQVDLVNVNTQQMRSTLEISEWRWDSTAERWWQVSGLPRYAADAR